MPVSEAQKKASRKYNDENTRQIKFGFSTKYDTDILAQLDAVPNKQGYIKELIRADIAKNGIAKPTPKPEPAPHKISLDNGAHYITAAEAMPEIRERNLWNIVIHFMNKKNREEVQNADPETEEEFLTMYLARSKSDLIIP